MRPKYGSGTGTIEGEKYPEGSMADVKRSVTKVAPASCEASADDGKRETEPKPRVASGISAMPEGCTVGFATTENMAAPTAVMLASVR